MVPPRSDIYACQSWAKWTARQNVGGRGRRVGENPYPGTSDDKVDDSRLVGNEGVFAVNGRGRDASDGTGTMIAEPQAVGMWQERRAIPFVGIEDIGTYLSGLLSVPAGRQPTSSAQKP